jgi:hypothetical protein
MHFRKRPISEHAALPDWGARRAAMPLAGDSRHRTRSSPLHVRELSVLAAQASTFGGFLPARINFQSLGTISPTDELILNSWSNHARRRANTGPQAISGHPVLSAEDACGWPFALTTDKLPQN